MAFFSSQEERENYLIFLIRNYKEWTELDREGIKRQRKRIKEHRESHKVGLSITVDKAAIKRAEELIQIYKKSIIFHEQGIADMKHMLDQISGKFANVKLKVIQGGGLSWRGQRKPEQ